jgi:Domain of unknown function (DUF6968)
MIIATRILTLNDKGEQKVAIRLHAPEPAKVDWICRFEIDWPDGKGERQSTGIDAVQALLAAMQMIGAELYASAQNKSGALSWLAPGRGFGFPVPNAIRDLLVGDDKKFL